MQAPSRTSSAAGWAVIAVIFGIAALLSLAPLVVMLTLRARPQPRPA